MRSALICVFFTLIVQRDGSCTTSDENEEEFKPTPIPLNTWPRDKLEPAGTLQEIIRTDATPAPAHYWEDALRHSVYLTLVRDKIDQLIAKGDYISPNIKPENMVAREIDDHDLWDKIKTARFDRLKEEPIPPADVTILAKGRLLEDEQGYRFIEDAAQNNCSDSNCAKGVKALWSVKRMRQGETSPGKYHYELTFSVTSQTNRKLKKAYENPVRTFTIKETTPPVDRQQVRPPHGKTIYHQERPQRALWVHRNINRTPNYLKRPAPQNRDLDRIFSSLFSDEDNYEEPYRHKPMTFFSNIYPQHAKVAHVDDRDPYYQKKVLPYPMKPHRYNTHPPIVTPPTYVQHPYWPVDPAGYHPYVQPYSDNRFLPSNVIKTTRPAVLPTPITNYPLLKESTIEVPVKTKLNATEYTTKEPDVVTTYKIYHHQKQQPPMKISYVSDHIRPPVYNAPPGVFVTMDKKPFKPMPPLKLSHMNKQQKPTLPDFRPSPQVLDTQFSEMDFSDDTAFRPISMDFSEVDVKGHDISVNNKKNVRKPVGTKKPGKKHEHIKSTHLTTVTPEIITAESLNMQEYNISDDDDDMEWANVLGVFSKTTPMASQREQSTKENIEPITSTTPVSTTVKDFFEVFGDLIEKETTSMRTTTTTTTSTTPKPKKRTRPPPKFNKPEKIKKHKRVTTTTTTTPKPTRTYPSKKPTYDLTPQASSAATSSTNSIRETKTHKPPASTTTRVESSTSPRPTTTTKLTTTSTSSTSTSSPTVDTEQPVVTTQPKSKNRFRQSTLMQKGTSVNHDKWSTSTIDKNRTNTATSNSYPLRRKASKFTGYIPSSTPRSPEVERNREDHRDRVYSFNKESISSTTEKTVEDDIPVKKLHPTLPTDEQLELKDDQLSEWSHGGESEQEEEKSVNESHNKAIPMDAQESKDDNEYIFPTASVIQEVKEYIGLQDEEPTTELTVVASPYSATKNKTKCKKKKHNNLTTTEGTFKSSSEPAVTDKPENSSTSTTTINPVTPDIFNELFGGFTMDDAKEEPKPELATPAPEQKPSESEKHEHYAHLDDDLEDFLHSLDQKSNSHERDDKLDEEYDDDLDDEGSPYNIDEESKHFKDDYYEDDEDDQESRNDQPFSLLELMDME